MEKTKRIASGHSNQSPSNSPVQQSPSKYAAAKNNPASPVSPSQIANSRQSPSSRSSQSATTATSAVASAATSSQAVASSLSKPANPRPDSQDIELQDDESCNMIRSEDGRTFHAVVVGMAWRFAVIYCTNAAVPACNYIPFCKLHAAAAAPMNAELPIYGKSYSCMCCCLVNIWLL